MLKAIERLIDLIDRLAAHIQNLADYLFEVEE